MSIRDSCGSTVGIPGQALYRPFPGLNWLRHRPPTCLPLDLSAPTGSHGSRLCLAGHTGAGRRHPWGISDQCLVQLSNPVLQPIRSPHAALWQTSPPAPQVAPSPASSAQRPSGVSSGLICTGTGLPCLLACLLSVSTLAGRSAWPPPRGRAEAEPGTGRVPGKHLPEE